jgi:hypothetical protein
LKIIPIKVHKKLKPPKFKLPPPPPPYARKEIFEHFNINCETGVSNDILESGQIIATVKMFKKNANSINIEIKDYVVFQKPQADRLPPPRTLIMDYTMTHVRFGRSHLHPMGQLTNTRRSDGAPDPDVVFKEVDRIKIRYYPVTTGICI